MYILVALCFGLAATDLTIKHEVTAEDLYGLGHLNDMLSNTLKLEKKFVLGDSFLPEDNVWKYSSIQATKDQLDAAHALVKDELGQDFDLLKKELEDTTMIQTDETWMTFVGFAPAVDGMTFPKVTLIKWDDKKRVFDIILLKGVKSVSSQLQKPHLIMYTSHFGFEADKPTLVAEEPNSEQMEAYRMASKALFSAFHHLAFLRGVDPNSAMSEVNFRQFKFPVKRMSLGVDPVTVILIGSAIVQAAAAAWGFICQIFGTKRVTKLIAELKNRGFKSYAMHATIRRTFDIPEEKVDRAAELLTRVLTHQHPDPAKQKKIKAGIAMCLMMDKNVISFDDGAIDASSASNDRFFTLMSHRGNDDKFSFVSMNMDATFELAPDLLFYKRSTSYVGGIYSTESLIIKEIPANPTQQDLEALSAFNIGLAIKLFSDELNLPGLQIPNFPQI